MNEGLFPLLSHELLQQSLFWAQVIPSPRHPTVAPGVGGVVGEEVGGGVLGEDVGPLVLWWCIDSDRLKVYSQNEHIQ